MRLSQNSGVPIYQQIADSFKSDILAGKYAQGEYLPSIRGLARDLKILCENGYELKRVRAVDQFCHTVHTESVCLMERKDK